MSLSKYVERKVSAYKVGTLFSKIMCGVWIKKGERDNNDNNIVQYISEDGSPHGWFAKCFKSLASPNDEKKADKAFQSFLGRVKKMKPWSDMVRPYIMKLINVVNYSFQTKIKAHENTETQNTESQENSINENLKSQRETNRRNKGTGEKIDFDETVKKANDEHKRLVGLGILSEGDNGRHSKSGDGGFSANFIKLFIRYIQRSFPELEKYVKIYHYLTPGLPTPGSDPDRRKAYWNKIKSLESKSKDDGVLYLVINQVGDSKSLGHANLTVVCNGDYKVFETVSNCLTRTIGGSDYDGKPIKYIPGSIQADEQNGVSIVFGYIESLMKQMSALIEKVKNKKLKEKQFSEHVWNKINKYSQIEISDDILGTDHSPLEKLLPPKYSRYIQTQTGRDKIINLPKTEGFNKLDEKTQNRIKRVATELEKVREKNDISKKYILEFLKTIEFKNEDFREQSYELRALYPGKSDIKTMLEDCINKFAKALGKNSALITLGDFKAALDEKHINVKKNSSYGGLSLPWKKDGLKTIKKHFDYGKKPIDYFRDNDDNNDKKLQSELDKPIYKIVCDDPKEMTTTELLDGDFGIFSVIKTILRMNDPAQMRRRRNLLKVATLVDVLEKQHKGSETIQDKVRDEVGMVEELISSP